MKHTKKMKRRRSRRGGAALEEALQESKIDRLIKLTSDSPMSAESQTDIIEVNCGHNNQPGCIQCRICGSVSGTTREIFHFVNCTYNSQVYDGPFNIGSYVTQRPMNSTGSVGIMQREYGIVNAHTSKTKIGTYGAGPCVILCMRDRITTQTTLAHIDGGTHNYFDPFSSYDPTKTDVYIVGGDNCSKKKVNQMLTELKERGFDIHFAHVIDEDENRFAIDCKDGTFYLNKHVPVESLPLVFDVQPREVLLMEIAFGMRSILSKVNITSREEIDYEEID